MCMCGGGGGGCGYLLAIYQQQISQKGAELRCRPSQMLDSCIFSPTVNPQWSHQHWYESGCKISSFWLHMNERLGVAVVLVVGSSFLNGVFFFFTPLLFLLCFKYTRMYIFSRFDVKSSSANVSFGAHLWQMPHSSAVQFISTHNQKEPRFLFFHRLSL